MKQIAKILSIDNDGDLLQVQAMEPKEAFERKGHMHGYRYEWGVNHYSFSENKEHSMDAYNLTSAEYDKWDSQFVHRYSKSKGEWYRKESVKTFKILEAG